MTRARTAAVAAWVCASACMCARPGARPEAAGSISNQEAPVKGSSSDDLARKLAAGKYGDFFNYSVRDKAVDRVWAEPGSLARLEAIVRDPEAPLQARFLASEVLFEKHFTFAAAIGPAVVAEIYAAALRDNLTGMANSWGLLYEHDDEGPVGVRFLMLGEAAVPALMPLLDDARTTLVYDGSEEATVGNGYQFRVKDFAAYYLGKIKRIPVAFHSDVEARDREIEALRRRL